MTGGLVSVTFRTKTPAEICDLCVRAGLGAVEWGGDIHVPAGDAGAAREARSLSREHGLEIAAYGSYYRVGDCADEYARCLDTACEMGAPVIRVWCGRKSSAEADADYRAMITDSLRAICEKAGACGVRVAPEFHGGTLTDDIDSLGALLEDTRDIPALGFYWQPRWDWSEDMRLAALDMIGERLANIHAFTWRHTPDIVRLPLAEGEGMWKRALTMAQRGHALMEFVERDSEDALLRDAAVLNGWLADIGTDRGAVTPGGM